jgi:hypothetical protein
MLRDFCFRFLGPADSCGYNVRFGREQKRTMGKNLIIGSIIEIYGIGVLLSFLLIVRLHGAHGKLILMKQTSVLIKLKTTTYLKGADGWGLVNVGGSIVRRLGPGLVIALLHSRDFMGAYKHECVITRDAEDESKDIPGLPLPSISRPEKLVNIIHTNLEGYRTDRIIVEISMPLSK